MNIRYNLAICTVLSLSTHLYASEEIDGTLLSLAHTKDWATVINMIDQYKINHDDVFPYVPGDLSLLAEAASQLNIRAIDELLIRGANVDHPGGCITPLMAAIFGHINNEEDESGMVTIEFLLWKGANPLVTDGYGRNCHAYLNSFSNDHQEGHQEKYHQLKALFDNIPNEEEILNISY